MNFIDKFLLAKLIIAPVIAFIVSFYAMPIIIRIAIRKELVAKPNHRTSHKGRVPNLGGVGIFLGFTSAFLFAANFDKFLSLQFFLLGLIWLFFIGLRDDILVISARKKLLGEIISVLAIVLLGDIRLTNLHGFLNIGEMAYIPSILLTVFVAIVIINALNLIDGIDGLASGVSIIASLFYGIYFLIAGDDSSIQFAILAFCTVGAVIPFFLFNVFGIRNKIFMGDAGALSLGFIISLLTIMFCEGNVQHSGFLNISTAPVIAVSVLILPLFDTLRVFIIRAMHGKSPFRPDKNHLHHNLLALGFTHRQSTAILLIFNIIFIVISLLGRNLPGWILFSIIAGLALILSEFIRFRLRYKQVRERNLQVYNTSTTSTTSSVVR